MTLLDIANFVCGLVNQTQAEDVTQCKGFVKQRFEMIWNDQLWKDSLVEYTQTLTSVGYASTSTWLPTKQTLLLPVGIGKVIAARFDVSKLNVESSEVFYRIDFDSFASTGRPSSYRLLSPAVWELDVSTHVSMETNSVAAVNCSVDSLSSDLVTPTRVSVALTASVGLTFTTTRIDAVSKDVNGAISIKDGATTFVALGSTITNAPKRQRIQILGSVVDGTVIRILGKSKVPTFTADADEPGLSGVENCLIAFAHGDMLKTLRQYQKSGLVMQEGLSLLEQLKKVETAQQAYSKRLIPEGGYAEDYPFNQGLLSTKPFPT